MRYFIRSVKYFVYFCLLSTVMIGVLVLIGAVEGNIDAIFEDGWNSLWKIVIFFAAVAAIYPKVGFISRNVPVNRNWEDIREDATAYFRERKYEVESETPEKITFRIRTMQGRLSKMFEDRVTVTRSFYGYEFEGLRKDILGLASGFERRFNSPEEE